MTRTGSWRKRALYQRNLCKCAADPQESCNVPGHGCARLLGDTSCRPPHVFSSIYLTSRAAFVLTTTSTGSTGVQ
jgi:hypothetical protein